LLTTLDVIVLCMREVSSVNGHSILNESHIRMNVFVLC